MNPIMVLQEYMGDISDIRELLSLINKYDPNDTSMATIVALHGDAPFRVHAEFVCAADEEGNDSEPVVLSRLFITPSMT